MKLRLAPLSLVPWSVWCAEPLWAATPSEPVPLDASRGTELPQEQTPLSPLQRSADAPLAQGASTLELSRDAPLAQGTPTLQRPASKSLPPASEAQQDPYLLPPTLAALGLFTAMRTTEAYLWPEPFAFRYTDRWAARYERAFTSPPKFDTSRGFMQWDGDRWTINVLGHGLLGSELYLRPRRCGFGWLGSLGFATAASALWEYGFEANGVQPSLVDLWYTPLSGLVFGEARFRVWQALGELENATWRSVLQATVDPIGEFSTGVFGAPC